MDRFSILNIDCHPRTVKLTRIMPDSKSTASILKNIIVTLQHRIYYAFLVTNKRRIHEYYTLLTGQMIDAISQRHYHPNIKGYLRSSRPISTSQKSSFLQPKQLFFIFMRRLLASSSELDISITFDLARPYQMISAENQGWIMMNWFQFTISSLQ